MSILEDPEFRAARARLAASAPRKVRKPVDSDRPDRVMTVGEWAELNAFSKATAVRMINRGEGPVTVQLSPRRIGIRVCDNRAWQESRLRTRTASTSPDVA